MKVAIFVALMQFVDALQMIDLLKPAYYSLEKYVAGKSIPDVSKLQGRKKLSDKSDKTGHVDHSLWDKVLKAHVTEGATINAITDVNVVDYSSIAKDENFSKYLEVLRNCDASTLAPTEDIAFWMNAYNAICISVIVEHEKSTATLLSSINDLTNKESAVWDKKAGVVAGEEMSLNDIEHTKLRKRWDEPAIHACIVCASASCPNLRPEAFTGEKLLGQMTDQMKDWMANPTKGMILNTKDSPFGKRKQLMYSRIFLWFRDDFGGNDGLSNWILPFLENDTAKSSVKAGGIPIRYFEYDWGINRQKNRT